MAVPEQIPLVDYVADGTVKKFDVPFDYDQQEDLHLFVDGDAPTIDKYFFQDNAFNFYVAPIVGQKVRIERITPKKRDTDYDLHTNTIRPKALNNDFDRIWFAIQESYEDFGELSIQLQNEIIARIQSDDEILAKLAEETAGRILGDTTVSNDLKNYVNEVVGAIIGDPDFQGIGADKVYDGNQTQDQINLFGGKKYDMPVGGYPADGLVRLDNGDIVKSTIPNNTNNPNTNLTGWIHKNAAQLLLDNSGKNQQEINDDVASRFASAIDLRNYGSPNDIDQDKYGLKSIVSGVPEVNVKTLGINSSKSAAQNKTLLEAAIIANPKVIFRVDEIIKLAPITIPADKAVSFYGLGGFTVDVQTDVLFTCPDTSTLYFNNLNVDGNDLLQRFFSTSGNIWFRENKVKRIRSITISASAGVVSYGNVGGKIALLEYNKITDISGILTGLTGDSAGATRAFTIQTPTLPTNNCKVIVRYNNFDNIFGREGDILQCYDALSDSDAKLSTSEVFIYKNTFGASNRRAIKVQGSNVKIRYNTFNTIDKTHPEWNRDGQGGAGIISIGTYTNQFNNKGCDIIGNTFNNKGGIKGSIYLQSHEDVLVVGNTQNGEDILDSGFVSIFGATCKRVTITDNKIFGLSRSEFGLGDGVTYSRNIHRFGNGIKGIAENMLGVPSNFVFKGNEVVLDKMTTYTFLGALMFGGSVTSPLDLKEAVIQNNTVSYAGNTAYGALLRVPNKSPMVLINATLIANHTYATDQIYSGGTVDVSDLVLLNNTNALGPYPVIRMIGTTAQRPTGAKIGQRYYDTTLLATGKPIEWNGTGWVDSTGASV